LETILGWIAVAVGAAGTALGIGLGRPEEAGERDTRGDWLVALVTVVGTFVLFLVTRMSEPPFAIGERLGYGLLIGGVFGAAAGIWAARTSGPTPWRSGIAAVGLPSLALLGVGLVLLLFGTYPARLGVYPQPALAGFMIGALGAAVLFRLALPAARGMDVWAVSAVALGATVLLAVYRYDSTADRFWWRAPLMVLAAAIVAQIASAGVPRRGRGFALPTLAASVITLGLTAIFAWRLFPDWSLLWVAAAGVVTFAFVAWLAGAAKASGRAAAAAALLVVALSALGFRMLAGFGIGIGMLAAWSILLPTLASLRREESIGEEEPEAAHVLIYAMFIGVGLLLLRLFLENYASELRGVDLRAHYTFVALVLGTVFPFVLMSFFGIPSQRGRGWRTAGAGAAGLFAAAAPLVILAIWGFKAALGFFAGTVAAEVFILFIYTGAARARGRGYVESALLVLAAQVSAVQLSRLVGPLAEQPRVTRLIVLAAVVALGLIWAVVAAVVSRGAKEE